MSEIQIWLLVAGLAVLAGVFAFNKWQEAQLRRKTDEKFGSRHQDVLLEGTGRAASDSQSAEGDAPVEHTLGLPPHAPAASASTVSNVAKARRGPILDERADYIAVLNFAAPHLGEEILRSAEELEARVTKSIGWEGFDPVSGELSALSPSVYYKTVRVGLQLVDRSGVASEAEITAFCQALQSLAVNLVGESEFASRSEAMKQSDQLDAFCADVDIQIGLNVVRPDGTVIPGTRIRALAESAGCTLDVDGRFRRLTEGGAELYSLANLEPRPFSADALATMTTKGVTVLLDVPRAPEDGSFTRFAEFAQHAARSLEGNLVDDNRQPVSTSAFAAIATQVATVRTRMEDEGIPAGGALALRLFS